MQTNKKKQRDKYSGILIYSMIQLIFFCFNFDSEFIKQYSFNDKLALQFNTET